MMRAAFRDFGRRLYSSVVVEGKRVGPSQINDVFGVKLDYGWFFVPKKLYAADYTIPLLREFIGNKYPDIGEKPRTFEEIQGAVNEWVASAKPRRPKPTKLTAVAREEAKNVKLLEKQLGKEHIKETKEKKKVEKKASSANKKKLKILDNKRVCLYVLEHGKMPDDYNYNEISLTHAWNHFAAKNYSSSNSLTYKADAKKALAVKWNQMSAEEREKERSDLIELMKQGSFYSQGKVLSIKVKYAKLKYKIFKAAEAVEEEMEQDK